MKIEDFKEHFKRFPIARYVNERIKDYSVKHQYNQLCQHYGTPSILKDPMRISQLGAELWQEMQETQPYSDTKPSALFVGTDWEQDRSGIIQGLSKLADVTLFHHAANRYGQRWPKSPSEIEMVRQHNGECLLHYLETGPQNGKFNTVIGQMWGFSMHWRALARAREMGLAVVNIAMDDRHAFVGRNLADGTRGGTMGLAPYLSLACTDAPECVKWYEAEGGKGIYLPEASDPDIFRPFSGPKLYDVCFVGANYGIRSKLVMALERVGIKVQTYGTGWPNGRIPTENMPELFARSKIVLGCGTIGYCEDFFALKLRDFDGPMSGSLYMTHDNPDLYPLFRKDAEIVTFRSVDELVEKAKYFAFSEINRESIAKAGRESAAKRHTWGKRFIQIFSKLHSD